MRYQLRPYQQAASDAAVKFFLDETKQYNALVVCPTGSGKSLLIADIAYRLNTDVLVFCPTKEILEQNYNKMCGYGVECSMYSASVNQKKISKVTFCTIGSVKDSAELFSHFKYIMVDEAHYISNRKNTMYQRFINELRCKIIGLTATPYRLEGFCQIDRETKKPKLDTAKSWLQILTGYKKPVFKEIIYNIQIDELLNQGYLAKVRYFDVKPQGWEQMQLFKNTSGSDFSDWSVRKAYDKTRFNIHLVNVIRRLLYNQKTGIRRKGILVFTRFVEEAMELALQIDGCAVVSGDTPKKEREEILRKFKSGEVKVVCNAACLTTGFDYPELDTVVMARPTMSLSLYYQIVGRCIRPHESKRESWFVDLCGNVERFGEVSDLRLLKNSYGYWNVYSRGRQLTNVTL